MANYRILRSNKWGLMQKLLILLNIIFGAVGLALVIVGGIVEVKSQEYFRYLGTLSYISASLMLILVGVSLFFIACFGCYGAGRGDYCIVMTYAAVLIVVFVTVLGVTIATFASGDKALGIIRKSMTPSFEKYNDVPKYKKAWDHLQKKFRCCGFDGSTDYEAKQWKIPKSCCKKTKRLEICELFETGCAERVFNEMKSNMTVIAVVCTISMVVLLLGIVLACCFGRQIKRRCREL